MISTISFCIVHRIALFSTAMVGYSVLQWCVIQYCNGGLFSTAMVGYSVLQWWVIQYCNGGLFSTAMVG